VKTISQFSDPDIFGSVFGSFEYSWIRDRFDIIVRRRIPFTLGVIFLLFSIQIGAIANAWLFEAHTSNACHERFDASALVDDGVSGYGQGPRPRDYNKQLAYVIFPACTLPLVILFFAIKRARFAGPHKCVKKSVVIVRSPTQSGEYRDANRQFDLTFTIDGHSHGVDEFVGLARDEHCASAHGAERYDGALVFIFRDRSYELQWDKYRAEAHKAQGLVAQFCTRQFFGVRTRPSVTGYHLLAVFAPMGLVITLLALPIPHHARLITMTAATILYLPYFLTVLLLTARLRHHHYWLARMSGMSKLADRPQYF
jgi:hypothetical protein